MSENKRKNPEKEEVVQGEENSRKKAVKESSKVAKLDNSKIKKMNFVEIERKIVK